MHPALEEIATLHYPKNAMNTQRLLHSSIYPFCRVDTVREASVETSVYFNVIQGLVDTYANKKCSIPCKAGFIGLVKRPGLKIPKRLYRVQL